MRMNIKFSEECAVNTTRGCSTELGDAVIHKVMKYVLHVLCKANLLSTLGELKFSKKNVLLK
jgi:hypothetical protein